MAVTEYIRNIKKIKKLQKYKTLLETNKNIAF